MKVASVLGALAVLCSVGSVSSQPDRFSRFVAADFDADGHSDVVVVERSGNSRSRLMVGSAGASFKPLNGAPVHPIVRDLAVGDWDRDGVLDLVTIGDGVLRAHQVEGGNLHAISKTSLSSGWTDRVTVREVDGALLVVVTEYDILPDQDVGTTTVRGFEVRAGTPEEVWAFEVKAHVGDLALTEDGETTVLVLETGAGDEGGDILAYDVAGDPELTWAARVTDGTRCLQVESAAGEQNRILFQAIDGRSHVYTVNTVGLQYDYTRVDLDALVSVIGSTGRPTSIHRLNTTRGQVMLRPLIR